MTHPERYVARGELVRIRHGVYTFAESWRELPPWERYLARVHATATRHPGAVFSHESAAALLGLPVFGDPLTVHVLVPPRGTSRIIEGVRAHRTSVDRTILEIDGLAMTSLVDTVVDLARHRHPAIGLAVADATLRLDPMTTTSAFAAANEGWANSRGRDLARWPIDSATPQAESTLESVSRAVMMWLGFPAPELQVVHVSRGGIRDRSDFTWPDVGLVGEADGDLKFDGRFGDPLALLRDQRDRDTRLRSGIPRIAHWGWTEATRVTPLRAQLVGFGLRAVQPENTARLHTLRTIVARTPPHRVTARR